MNFPRYFLKEEKSYKQGDDSPEDKESIGFLIRTSYLCYFLDLFKSKEAIEG